MSKLWKEWDALYSEKDRYDSGGVKLGNYKYRKWLENKYINDLLELQMRREVEEMLKKLKLNMMFDGLIELYTFDSKTYFNLAELHTKLKGLTDET